MKTKKLIFLISLAAVLISCKQPQTPDLDASYPAGMWYTSKLDNGMGAYFYLPTDDAMQNMLYYYFFIPDGEEYPTHFGVEEQQIFNFENFFNTVNKNRNLTYKKEDFKKGSTYLATEYFGQKIENNQIVTVGDNNTVPEWMKNWKSYQSTEQNLRNEKTIDSKHNIAQINIYWLLENNYTFKVDTSLNGTWYNDDYDPSNNNANTLIINNGYWTICRTNNGNIATKEFSQNFIPKTLIDVNLDGNVSQNFISFDNGKNYYEYGIYYYKNGYKNNSKYIWLDIWGTLLNISEQEFVLVE